MGKWEAEYQKEQEIKHKLAGKIWSNSFHSGLLKFTKKELLILISEIENRIAWEYERSWTEMDMKDVQLEQKFWLIETLSPEFFKKEK